MSRHATPPGAAGQPPAVTLLQKSEPDQHRLRRRLDRVYFGPFNPRVLVSYFLIMSKLDAMYLAHLHGMWKEESTSEFGRDWVVYDETEVAERMFWTAPEQQARIQSLRKNGWIEVRRRKNLVHVLINVKVIEDAMDRAEGMK